MSSNEKSTTTVTVAVEGDLGQIRFAPQGTSGVNIFSSRVLGELGNAVDHITAKRDIRFIVFRGEGRAFLAGADIAEMQGFDESRGESLSRHGHTVMDAIEALPVPTFALMNGHALGGGCELAMACDFRIMVADGRIGQPEARLGLIPGWGATQRLAQLVGASRARWMIYSGESITAHQAHEIGLIDEVVDDEAGLDEALARWTASLRQASATSIARIKGAMRGCRNETQEFSYCFNTTDSREGMQAFMNKRTPAWAQQTREQVEA